MEEEVGEVVACHGAGHVAAVTVGVPLVAGDAARALAGRQEVHGEDLALGAAHHGAAVAGVGGRQTQGRIAEEAGVGVNAGIDDGDGLALAEDSLAEDRCRLAAGEARLAHPDGGVVEKRLAPFELDPEDVAQGGDGPAQGGDLRGIEQQADAGEVRVAAGAGDPLGSQVPHRLHHPGKVGVGQDVDHHRLNVERLDGGSGLRRLHGGDLARDLVLGLERAAPGGAERGEEGLGRRAGRQLHQVGVVGQIGVDPRAGFTQGRGLAGRHRRGELDQHDLVLARFHGLAHGPGGLALRPAGVDDVRLERDDPRLQARRALRHQTGADGGKQQQERDPDLFRSRHWVLSI